MDLRPSWNYIPRSHQKLIISENSKEAQSLRPMLKHGLDEVLDMER